MIDDHVRFQYLGNTPTSDAPILSIIVFSIIVHSLVYSFLPSSLSLLVKSYVVSTLHAIICVISVGNYFARYSVNLKQINRIAGGGVNGTGDEVMIYSICYSLGYFIYDLLLMLFHKSVRTNAALAHHIIVLVGFSTGVWYRICHPCHFFLLAEELSTIPLNMKMIYHERARLYRFFGYLFILTFFLIRLVYGSIICGYAFRAAPHFIRMTLEAGDFQSFVIGLTQAALCLLTRILNFYWSILILRKLYYSRSSKEKTS